MLWIALYYQQSEAIGGITREEMFSYILIAFALNNLLSFSTENILSREIRNGTVVARCVRPVSFLGQIISEMLGFLIIQGIVNLIIVIIVFVLFGSYMIIPSLSSLVLFIPCAVLSVILRIMLIEISSLLCFFSTGYLGISWTRDALMNFFSGAFVPVALFPSLLKQIAYMTPFPYILQVPISILLNQEPPVSIFRIFITQSVWIIFLLLLHSLVYGYIRRNMNIAGG